MTDMDGNGELLDALGVEIAPLKASATRETHHCGV